MFRKIRQKMMESVNKEPNRLPLPEDMDTRIACVLGFQKADNDLCQAFRKLVKGWDESEVLKEIILFFDSNKELELAPAVREGTEKLSVHLIGKLERRKKCHAKIEELVKNRAKKYEAAGANTLKKDQERLQKMTYEVEHARKKAAKHNTNEYISAHNKIRKEYEEEMEVFRAVLDCCENIKLLEESTLPELVEALSLAHETKLPTSPGVPQTALEQIEAFKQRLKEPEEKPAKLKLINFDQNELVGEEDDAERPREIEIAIQWELELDKLREEEEKEKCELLGLPYTTPRTRKREGAEDPLGDDEEKWAREVDRVRELQDKYEKVRPTVEPSNQNRTPKLELTPTSAAYAKALRDSTKTAKGIDDPLDNERRRREARLEELIKNNQGQNNEQQAAPVPEKEKEKKKKKTLKSAIASWLK